MGEVVAFTHCHGGIGEGRVATSVRPLSYSERAQLTVF